MDFPSRLLFQTIAPCPRCEQICIDGDPSDWADVPALPALPELDGQTPFATVQVAYGEAGLFLGLRVPKQAQIAVNRQRPSNGDSLQVWVDTRGVSGGHRATRFCTHFVLLPAGGGANRREPTGLQRPIRRALDQPPMCDPEDISIAVDVGPDSYFLEALLPTHIVIGFEPEAGSIIGFQYLVTDLMQGRQTYAVGDEFPYSWDPGTWGQLRLEE